VAEIATAKLSIDPRLLPVFAIATGGALHSLWPESYPINLLPAELVERQERQTRRLALLLQIPDAGVVVVFVIVLAGKTLAAYHAEKPAGGECAAVYIPVFQPRRTAHGLHFGIPFILRGALGILKDAVFKRRDLAVQPFLQRLILYTGHAYEVQCVLIAPG